MAGSGLQNFITAHRAKLDQQKQYLRQNIVQHSDSERGSVLPLHNHDNERAKLSKERQTEYQQHLKQKEFLMHQKHKDVSVQERRRQLAEERDNELRTVSSQSRNTDSRKRHRNYKSEGALHVYDQKDPFEELRDRKRDEKSRYHHLYMNDDDDDDDDEMDRSFNWRQLDPLYRLEKERYMDEVSNSRRRRHRIFDNDYSQHKVHFDGIEDDNNVTDNSPVMRIHKQSEQQDTHKYRENYPQDKNDEFASRSRRANSAPLVTKGLMMLGSEEPQDIQRKKKQMYADELREQMEQKEKEKRLEKLERLGLKVSQTTDSKDHKSVRDLSDKENHLPPHSDSKPSHHHQIPSPKLRRHSRDHPPERVYRNRLPHPMDYYDYYQQYPPVPQYYSPPPPLYAPHYGQHDYSVYPSRAPVDQSRRSRAYYDDDEFAHHPRQAPVEEHVAYHDRHEIVDQPRGDGKYVGRSPEGKAAYREELRKQIVEKRSKDEKAKLEEERYHDNLRKEIQEYDPWGRGGGGAPNQDYRGNIVTDLRKMRKENETNLLNGTPSTSPRAANIVVSRPSTKSGQGARSEGKSPPPQTQQSSQEAYKEALQNQIAEKERAKQLEKEKQKMEDEKELLRLEKQRLKLQEEYERELAQQKAKEEEARRKNEVMKKEAEEKRVALLRKREEEELKQVKQMASYKPPTPQPVVTTVEFRSMSPVVPALQHQQLTTSAPRPPSSPPVPALRNAMTGHLHVTDDSKDELNKYQHVDNQAHQDEQVDVLKQLSRMRQEFENEQKKIHRQLSNSSVTNVPVVVSRPRRVAKDVFQKKPIIPLPSVHSNTAAPLPGAIQQDASEQFNDLKYRKTSSRLSFMKKYPAPPISESTLDIQQDALLRQQERDLAKLRSDLVTTADHHPQLSSGSRSTSHVQQADVSRKNLFGDRTLLEQRLTSAANTVSQNTVQKADGNLLGRPPSHGGLSMSSIATLDVENIAARNEERMRRLDAILNSSKTDSSDPDVVIRKFLENRDHSVLLPKQKRRASEVSLDADTKMCPIP